jgi:anthraniloyl-CoA monooxygenase
MCVGGGPAGLYFAILMKRQDPGHDITVVERNPADLTPGWGVVFWDDLLELLRRSDPESAREICDRAFQWRGQWIEIDGNLVVAGGYGYGLARRRLLDILGKRATELGVRIQFDHEYDLEVPPDDVDLVVACDGAHSNLRKRQARSFGPTEVVGRNRYVWLGTSRVFDTFVFAFAHTDAGYLWTHAYAFADDCSTCIVECTPETWTRLGFDRLSIPESLRLLEKIFADQLDGHPFMVSTRNSDTLPWLTFRTVTNRRWFSGKTVLLGDAAHTTHFSIGSGTKLAIEDATVLASALYRHDDLPSALEDYEATRRAALLLPQREAANSARWLEQIDRFVTTDPRLFAFLLHQRRSNLVTRIPTPAFRLARVVYTVPLLRPLLRLLWERGGSWLQRRYIRRHRS